MKLSVQTITLLAGLAASSPTQFDRRQAGKGQEALQKYCSEPGYNAGNITETDEGLTGTCLDKAGSNSALSTPKAGVDFCNAFTRPFGGAAAVTGTAAWTVWCGRAGEGVVQRERATGMALVNKIVAESDGDKEKLKTTIMSLTGTSPDLVTGMYNALKAAPSSAKGSLGLGGAAAGAPIVATMIFDFISANTEQGGLFGPETKIGQWLRINPIRGKTGTQPSPQYQPGLVYSEQHTPTQMCWPFKDQSEWYWIQTVKRCRYWHDEKQCDTSYSYDDKSRSGKIQAKVCENEQAQAQLTPEAKAELLKKEEGNCFRPRRMCSKPDGAASSFMYCMDDTTEDIQVCEANGFTSSPMKDKDEAQIEKEKEQNKKNDEAGCFSPRWACRNARGDFLYCMDGDETSLETCKKSQWYPERAPERKTN